MGYPEMAGKTAIITGGAASIGRAIVEAFAREKVNVVIADVSDEKGVALAEKLKAEGFEASYVHADMSNEEDIKNMVLFAVDTYGGLHYAANNAGISSKPMKIGDMSTESYQRVIDVNQIGIFNCNKYEVQAIAASGGGAVVNSSSAGGKGGIAMNAPYCSTKAAVIGITKCAALEYVNEHVRFNAIAPSYIENDMRKAMRESNPAVHEALCSANVFGRMGTCEEVADVIVWLCSDRSSFVNGTVIDIDSGNAAKVPGTDAMQNAFKKNNSLRSMERD